MSAGVEEATPRSEAEKERKGKRRGRGGRGGKECKEGKRETSWDCLLPQSSHAKYQCHLPFLKTNLMILRQ